MREANQVVDVLSLPSDQDATGRTLGREEIAALSDAIATGTLTSTKGSFVKSFEERFARRMGVKHAFACASGTGALHTAFAALNFEPGDEVVTTSITDMGALTPILYQGGIPVFADVDSHTYNVTAESIERVLSEKTQAIVATHLFGNPCNMREIMELANSRGIPVIEDCAQSFLAEHQQQLVGTFGSVGCFSLQQGKHITTGEGGIVVTNDDEIARRMFLFINKAWGYGDEKPDHYFIALNYRMCELQGAVAGAQLEKLDEVARARSAMAEQFTARISHLPGIECPKVAESDWCTFWKYCLHVDPNVIPGGPAALGKHLRVRGIACAPRYIQKPAFRCQVFAEQKTFGNSRWPFTLARPEAVDYDAKHFPGTFEALDRILVLPWNERYGQDHLEYLAVNLEKAVKAATAGETV